MMNILSKCYDSRFDFSRVMDFLRETYMETGSLYNHFPTRFENDKNNYPEGIHLWEKDICDTESEQKRIIGLSLPTRKFIYFVQVHPNYEYIINEIVDWIIVHSIKVKNDPNNKQELHIISLEGYKALENVLSKKGFVKDSIDGLLRIRSLDTPIQTLKVPDGFILRSIHGKTEYFNYAKAIRETFGHGEWFNEELVAELNSKSYYRQNLDLIIEAPNGDIASFCTFRVDSILRTTELEPLGTLPKYRGLGLGKIIIYEGLKRLKDYAPTLLFIGGAADNPAANALYESTGFEKKGTFIIWKLMI